MAEFWALTPAEMAGVFAARAWRAQRDHERDLTVAWYTAALSRGKRLPPLHRLLHPPQTRKLSGAEKAKRAAEFAELKARMGGDGRGG